MLCSTEPVVRINIASSVWFYFLLYRNPQKKTKKYELQGYKFGKDTPRKIPEFWVKRPKLCGNCTFPQHFQTRKLGEILVFCLVSFKTLFGKLTS